MHPFLSTSTPSGMCACRSPSMRAWSIEMAPSSFSMTAMRSPCSFDVSMRLTSVVFPLPRKPVTIVIGTLPAAAGGLALPSA